MHGQQTHAMGPMGLNDRSERDGFSARFPARGWCECRLRRLLHGAPFAAAGKSKCPDSHLTSASHRCAGHAAGFVSQVCVHVDLMLGPAPETPAVTFDRSAPSGCRANKEHDLGNLFPGAIQEVADFIG